MGTVGAMPWWFESRQLPNSKRTRHSSFWRHGTQHHRPLLQRRIGHQLYLHSRIVRISLTQFLYIVGKNNLKKINFLHWRSSGDFLAVETCGFGGYMTSFQLRVSPAGTEADNTAVNDIRFRCSNGDEINGIGNTDGTWGDYSDVCENGICGMETLLQPYAGGIGHYDNTALNDVRFTCCK